MPFQCHICGKGYTSKFNYDYHYAHHFDDRPFLCTMEGCSSAYKTKADLRQHEKSHEKALGIQFICGECQMVFDSSTKLNVHKRDYHTSKETSKWCELCERTFANLRNHRKTVHENIRRFSCDFDGKRFSRMTGLTRHIETVHLKLSPYPCTQCDKRFKEAGALKKHLNVHEKFFHGERFKKKIVNPEDCSDDEEIALKTVKYKCSSCTKSFFSKNQMLKHQSSAHADLPYSCDICDQLFATKHRILLHMKTHKGGERPEHVVAVKKMYMCGVCKKLISSKSALERHKSTIHLDIYNFMCDVCSARFRDRSSLNRHLVKHHKKAVETSTDFICLHCGKQFFKLAHFYQHEAICQMKLEIIESHQAADIQEMNDFPPVRLKTKTETPGKSIIQESNNLVKIETEAFGQDEQQMQIMKQEVIHREVIQCKLCPMVLDSTEEFKDHFVAKHVRLQNVSFSAAKKLNKPVIIKSFDYGQETQTTESFVKGEPTPQEALEEIEDYENIETLENDCSGGDPEDLDENELQLMMQGETFNADTSSFDCRICQAAFEDLDLLKLHCSDIHGINKLGDSFIARDDNIPSNDVTCNFCAKVLSTKMSLKRHIQLVHNNERTELFCDQCGHSFKDIRALKKHIAKGHTDVWDISKPPVVRRRKTTKRMTCDECGEEVFGQLGLAQHWWNVHKSIKIVDKTRYHCLICRQVMNTRATAMRHHSQVHEDGRNLFRSCRVCEMDFQLYNELKSHVELYHAGGHICLVCGFGFETSLDLFNHSKMHRAVPENEKKLSCDLCGFRAQQKVTIETHMSNSHGASRKAYAGNTCEYCGVFFKCYQSFYTHLKNNHPKSAKDAEKYSCAFCKLKFKYNRDLRNHELLHLDPNAKQFQCSYEGCGRKYSSYCSFKGHVKYAHETNRNQCRVCREEFQSRAKLIGHTELVHPETRQYSCSFCGKSFMSPITQLRHMKICVSQ